MQNPLQLHILALETKLGELRDQLTKDSLPDNAREAISAHIQFAADALNCYRRAIELEHMVNSNPADANTK